MHFSRVVRSPGAFAVLLLMPIVVGLEPAGPDSSSADFLVVGGAGSYADIERGCEGEVLEKHRIPYHDAMVAASYSPRSPIVVSMTGGFVSQKRKWPGVDHPSGRLRNRYLNPEVSFEWDAVGVGAGFLVARRELYPTPGGSGWRFPTGHLRLGPPQFYLLASLLDGAPLYSGGGFIDFGLGFRAGRRCVLLAGAGIGAPYDDMGALLKSRIKMTRNLDLLLSARAGQSEGLAEYGISLGLDYRVAWRR